MSDKDAKDLRKIFTQTTDTVWNVFGDMSCRCDTTFSTAAAVLGTKRSGITVMDSHQQQLLQGDPVPTHILYEATKRCRAMSRVRNEIRMISALDTYSSVWPQTVCVPQGPHWEVQPIPVGCHHGRGLRGALP